MWTVMDPESKLLVVIDVGTRTLEMAQHVVHQVVQVLAPDCMPLFVTDGFREYMTALLSAGGAASAAREPRPPAEAGGRGGERSTGAQQQA
jgi:hypothetical protein